MTGVATDNVLGMAEENEVRQHINRLFRRYLGIFRQIESSMANLAFLSFRERCALGDFCGRVAGDALHFQRRVARVAELDRRGA